MLCGYVGNKHECCEGASSSTTTLNSVFIISDDFFPNIFGMLVLIPANAGVCTGYSDYSKEAAKHAKMPGN